jgi:S-DNA-T family DNA segregation ATPase FtsK/SpoIIIE
MPRSRRTDASHRAADIAGVLVIAFGVLVALSLALPDTGMLGGAAKNALSALFGNGAWAVCLVFVGTGIGILRGRSVGAAGSVAWGLIFLFCALLAGIARPAGGEYFDPEAASGSGGYVGALLGFLLEALLGAARWLGIAVLGLVGLVLCLNAPLRTKLAQMRERAAQAKSQVKLPGKTESPRLARVAREGVRNAPEAREVLPTSEEPRPKRKPIIREIVPMPSLATESSIPKEGYQLPPISLLADPPAKPKRSQQEMQRNIETLEGTLEEFGIDANVVEVATGPTVTRYEIQLGPGIRVARITALADNIAMNLAASHVRVEAPIPGKAAIGVEVPNSAPTMVTLKDVADTRDFMDHPSRLAVCLGQDVSGANKYADLTKMPHLLIGGATNSGKSIGLSAIITSLLMRNTPKDVRMVMIDPKRVELTLFDGIPHLMCPVIKDVKEAPGVLRAVWREMDRRYDLLSEQGVRNIDGWNAQANFQDKLPYIVVIIDELADLMIQAAAEVETSIVRIAQLARAVGIHLVIATQRPSVDVITGTIKANIPSRVAFAVSSQIDSRTILDQKGAEDLIGKGDMLYMPIDASKPVRIQGCYVGEKEIEAVCSFWRNQEAPQYVLDPVAESAADPARERGEFADKELDPLWADAVRWVAERGEASTSMLQRRFSIGFQRASRLLDMMEERGIVGPRDGPRPREALISAMEVEDVLAGGIPGGVRYETGWIGDGIEPEDEERDPN